MFTQLIQQITALSPENRACLLTLYQQLFQQAPINKADYLPLIADFPYLIVEDQLIVAAFGLDRRPSRHKLIINDIERFTWCVWDAFFLAEILTKKAEIHTNDPINHKALIAQWSNGKWQLPSHVCASFPLANKNSPTQLRTAFCQFVHLFSDQHSGEQYAAHTGVEIVSAETLLRRSREMAQALTSSLSV